MESGVISDAQISASSQYTDYTAARKARLNFKKNLGWTTSTNNLNQWLQVDLGSYTTITRIATQGNFDANPQWVTKYRLQFGDDGMTFQFYKKPTDTSPKVYR